MEMLCCPECGSDLQLTDPSFDTGEVVSGALRCTACPRSFPIREAVPRFVDSETYGDSFGVQWNAFPTVQHDAGSLRESEGRFDTETGLSAVHLAGKTILEVGSGNGRFVDVVARRGAALVVGVDLSRAVDAAQRRFGGLPNVGFVQADVFRLPFRNESYDHAYSIGVLHHTPDPRKAWLRILPVVKAGGRVCVSVYDLSLQVRGSEEGPRVALAGVGWAINTLRAETFRWLASRLPRRLWLWYCRRVVPWLHALNKVPGLRIVRYALPSTCYAHLPREWSVLDTYDTYATKIVHRFSPKQVFAWYRGEGLEAIEVHDSRTGWTSVSGQKPATPVPPPPR